MSSDEYQTICTHCEGVIESYQIGAEPNYCACKEKMAKGLTKNQMVATHIKPNRDTKVIYHEYYICEARTCIRCKRRGQAIDFMGKECDLCVFAKGGGLAETFKTIRFKR